MEVAAGIGAGSCRHFCDTRTLRGLIVSDMMAGIPAYVRFSP